MIKLVSKNSLRANSNKDLLRSARRSKMLDLAERAREGVKFDESDVAKAIFESFRISKVHFHEIEDEDDMCEWTDFLHEEVSDGVYKKLFEFDFEKIALEYMNLYRNWLNEMREKIANSKSLVDAAELIGFVESMSIEEDNEFLKDLIGQCTIRDGHESEYSVEASDENFFIIRRKGDVYLAQIVAHNL